jgi:tetratricopeptide (TPR) repeat protein
LKEKKPDKRSAEKMSSDLAKLLGGQKFKGKKDIQAFLDSIMKGGMVPDMPPETAVESAQEIMYDAWDSETARERIKLAKKALSVSPDCADAYNLLADEEARTLDEAKELYQKGVEAGERALGKKVFKEYKGHFWGYFPSRPYMRSRAGLMRCLWESGEHAEAIRHAKEMLKLNTIDNQGIRYLLVAYLTELGMYDELEQFMAKGGYKDDCAVEWLYPAALLAFVKEGDSKGAEKKLKTAIDFNKHVPEYLTGKKPIPRYLPDSITMGGEDEAFCYAATGIYAWKKVPGAVEWLKKQSGMTIIPKAGRNDDCPCGSGKKYKKCCGT